MCGIAGHICFSPAGADGDAAASVLRMVREMRHRGPDDRGVTLIDRVSGRAMDLAAGATGASMPHDVGLGHSRFSIVDLSPAGHQPFWSADRRVCVTFNGEIYNHVELRRELEKLGHVFRSNSDTEVLVQSYQRWGTECFSRFVGFWAIALYDASRRAVLLSRDRIGKAPLYLARHAGSLWFASEVPAILSATGRRAFAVRGQAVADFMAHGWRDVHHQTFYEGIESFPNACFAWVGADGNYHPREYWRLPRRRLTERELPVEEAIAEFRRRLADAVAVRMRADVPIGFELSGGLDSSCLLAAAASGGHRIHAYTVSFPGTSADEEPYARLMHERYRGLVDYTVLRPLADDFWGEADEYVARIAEPFHAPNILTNRGIWRAMAARGIRVSINGAAGDESWGGYFNDYYEPFLRQLARRGDIGPLINNCRLFGEAPHKPWSATFLRRFGRALQQAGDGGGPDSGYLTSSFGSRTFALPDELNPLRPGLAPGPGPARDLEGMLVDHMGPWRMNYWLRVSNPSYMSVPTELRCPFLDHRLVELAFTVPTTYLIRDGWLKWLPRVAMAGKLPPEIAWRKRKMGFPFPYNQWAIESRGRFFAMLAGTDCPWVDGGRLRRSYDSLARSNPLFLWRVMSLCLWWKKCVLGESLQYEPPSIAAA
jgi:asparagine synthase (glutamine-hydrolysing)